MEKIICTDLDGTLLYPKKKIRMLPSDTKRFLSRFKNDGGSILLVSGRNTAFPKKLFKKIEMEENYISCNGAVVVSKGKIIKETIFEPERIKSIISYMRNAYKIPLMIVFSKAHNMVCNVLEVSKITNIGYILYQFYQGVLKEPFIRNEKVFWDELEHGMVYKVMMMFGLTKKKIAKAKEANKELRERFKDVEFSWAGEFIEISPKGCTKSEGINFYLDYNRLSKDNVMVVGDSGNDISMFQTFKENSFCMDHGPEEVKKYVSHTIHRFSDLEGYIYPSEEIAK